MTAFTLSTLAIVAGIVSGAVVPQTTPPPLCDSNACNKSIAKYYQEINCKPVLESGACCPAKYDCPAASSRVQTKCHLKGVAYNPGQNVSDALAGNPCTKECRCEMVGDIAKFECASTECFPEIPDGCIGLYKDINSCCPSSTYCKATAKAEPASKKPFTCTLEGKTYIENERFLTSPLHPCKTCTCQRGFNGTLDGPWCQEVSCDIELLSGRLIQRGCAPIYYGTKGCCPISWRCPADTDAVIPAEKTTPPSTSGTKPPTAPVASKPAPTPAVTKPHPAPAVATKPAPKPATPKAVPAPPPVATKPAPAPVATKPAPTVPVAAKPAASASPKPAGGQCKFGKLLLNQNDKLSSTTEDLVCTCAYPPNVTCVQNEVQFNLDLINES